jgi:hypothetical protein
VVRKGGRCGHRNLLIQHRRESRQTVIHRVRVPDHDGYRVRVIYNKNRGKWRTEKFEGDVLIGSVAGPTNSMK